ncbi:MAG: hypothetical protein AAGA90_17690 [Actinomycetota bacterium]
MRLLRRRGAGFDPTMGDDELQMAVDRLCEGDWRFVQELFARRDDSWVISTVLHDEATAIPLGRFLEWESESGSALAMAHLGQARAAEAWKIRGTMYAHEVTDDIRDAFLLALEEAEATLQEAVRMDPAMAEPWVGLMSTGRGLELRKEEVERRFVEVHAREPFRPDACHQMLQTFTAKWIGSHEEMFQFAEWIQREAPADSPCADLMPMAHIEYVLSGHEPGLMLSEYLRRQRVSDELQSTARRMLNATSGRAETRHLQALNLFLLTVEPINAMAGRIVREAISRIDDRPTAMPWRYYGDRIDVRFAQIRDEKAKAAKRL